jgi:hypothetical protein
MLNLKRSRVLLAWYWTLQVGFMYKLVARVGVLGWLVYIDGPVHHFNLFFPVILWWNELFLLYFTSYFSLISIKWLDFVNSFSCLRLLKSFHAPIRIWKDLIKSYVRDLTNRSTRHEDLHALLLRMLSLAGA